MDKEIPEEIYKRFKKISNKKEDYFTEEELKNLMQFYYRLLANE